MADYYPDIVGGGIAARKAGFDEMQDVGNAFARRQAGNALASGDYAGGANALFKGGLLSEGAGVQDQQYQQQTRQKATADAEKKARGEFFLQAADAISKIPDDGTQAQRRQALQTLAPTFQAMGVAPEHIQALMSADLSDRSLQVFKGSIAKELQFFQTDAGIYAGDKNTGKVTQSLALPGKPLEMDPTKNYYMRDMGGESAAAAPAGAPAATPGAPQPAGQAQPTSYTPQDRDALARMIATEAGGEGPQGMMAAGAVALNRLKSGYGGAKSVADVVNAPHQFEGMSRAAQVSPQAYQTALAVADQLLSGQAQDPTGGAVNFINPELQAQMGRPQPAWAPQGQGRRIGRHVFYGGQNGGGNAGNVQLAANTTSAPGAQPTASDAPQIPGYRLIQQGRASSDWVQLSPEESKVYGPGTFQRNNRTGELKQVSGTAPKGSTGRLPAAALNLQNDHLSAIQTASAINTRLDVIGQQLDSGTLNLGPVTNVLSAGANLIGRSDQQTRNYASFRGNLEKLRNDSLRLNKGVQTEGDAERAWKELFANINDEGVVRQRLDDIETYNRQALAFHQDAVTQLREDAGLPPIDPSRFQAKPIGAAQSARSAAKTPAVSAGSPPVSVLKDGHITTFANGQRWTLRGGKPARVQ